MCSYNIKNIKIHFVKILPASILLFILLFHFINNAIWLKHDGSLVRIGYDSCWHLLEAVKFKLSSEAIILSKIALLDQLKQILFLLKSWDTLAGHRPPLVYLISSLIKLDSFYYYHIRLYVNFLFFAALIIAIYFLGKKYFNKRVGLLASFLVSFYPAIYALSRQFESDFIITSLTISCVCLLAYSNNFNNRLYSFLFGIILGCASLVKMPVFIFLFPFLFYTVIKIIRENDRHKKVKAFINLTISAMLSYIIFCFWWGNRLQTALSALNNHAFFMYNFFKGTQPPTLSSGCIRIFSLKNFLFYPLHIASYISLPFFMLFMVSLILFIIKKNKRKIFFLFGLSFPLLLYVFVSVKVPRYVLPVFPFFALISAWGVYKIKSEVIRRIVLCACVIYALVFYFLTTWNNANFYQSFLNSKFLTCELKYTFPKLDIYLKQDETNIIFSNLKNRLKDKNSVKISYTQYVPHIALPFYLFLRDYILVDRVHLERNDEINLYDADYVAVSKSQYLHNGILFKEHKKLFDKCDVVFLEKISK